MSRISPADEMAARAGLSLREIARQWPTWNRRLTPKQLDARAARIRRAWRTGGLNPEAAVHLAHLLACHPMIFIQGAASYSGETLSGAAGTRLENREPATPQRSRDACGRDARSPSLRRRPSPDLKAI